NNDNDKPYCMISIAVDKPLAAARIKELEQKGEPTADFFDVTCYDDPAVFLKNQIEAGRIKAGTLLEVTGRMEQRRWTTPQGDKRSGVGLRAHTLRTASRLPHRAALPDPLQEGKRLEDLVPARPARLPETRMSRSGIRQETLQETQETLQETLEGRLPREIDRQEIDDAVAFRTKP